MIERKLTPGEFISLGDISEIPPQGAGPEVTFGCEDRTIGISENFFGPKKRTINPGENLSANKGHRNFIWLPFMPTKTNYTLSQGKDVLSGKFSGCYMISYTVGGMRRVAHVATPEAKASWNATVANVNYQMIAGFQPMESVNVNGLNMLKDDLDVVFLGLITAIDTLYSVVLAKLDARGTRFRIMKVDLVPSLAHNVLTNLP